MRLFTLAILLGMPAVAAAQGGCAVNFDPAILKGPGLFESVWIVVKGFNPTGEAQRLSDLRQVVLQLKQSKADLAEILNNVAQQNSLPDWLKARTQQIPAIEDQIVTLLGKMRSEAKKGGLFAGDQSFADLGVITDEKVKQLRQLCLLTNAPLPLDPEVRQRLNGIVSVLNAEISTLREIDKELQKLIQKANEEEKNHKSK